MPLPTPCSVFGYNPNLAEKKNASFPDSPSGGGLVIGIGDDQYNTGQDARRRERDASLPGQARRRLTSHSRRQPQSTRLTQRTPPRRQRASQEESSKEERHR